jgi:hypothetical protein
VLLAILLLEANRVVSASRLIEALWEDEQAETAQKAVQVYVSQLRKLLGKDRLETKPPGYRLHVDEGELDLDRFRGLVEQGCYDEALAHWRGSPLSDFASQRFAQAEIARLDELRVSCFEARIEQGLAQGRHLLLVGELDALVREHPLRSRRPVLSPREGVSVPLGARRGRRAFVRSDAPAAVNLISRAAALLPANDAARVELIPNVRVMQGWAATWAGQRKS